MTTIEITVSPQGETTVETKGFTGDACRAASRFVEEALGRPTSERLTAAFYQGNEARNNLRQSS